MYCEHNVNLQRIVFHQFRDMENIHCGHCGAFGIALSIHGAYYCGVCKCLVCQEQDIQEQDLFDEELLDFEPVSRVTFHTYCRSLPGQGFSL